jgi:hypothetical protein
MGRFAWLSKGLSRGLPVIGAVGDYAEGKSQGEDDIRAGVGAAGSALGGWKGAAAGAVAGQLAIPIPIVGGAVGAVAGGIAGAAAGGWGADRVDDLIRGNKNNKEKEMATFSSGYAEDERRRMEEERAYNNRGYGTGDFLGQAINAAGLGGLGYGVYANRESLQQIPGAVKEGASTFNDVYRRAGNAGLSRTTAANAAATEAGGQMLRGARNAARNIPLVGKAALIAGGLKLVDDTIFKGAGQRTLAGGFDAVTGNVFDLDGRGDGRTQQQRLDEQRQAERTKQQQDIDAENRRRTENLPSNDPYLSAIQGMSEVAQDKLLRRLDSLYERNLAEGRYTAERSTQVNREDFLTETQAKQASELMSAYSRDIPQSVSTMLNSVFNARY